MVKINLVEKGKLLLDRIYDLEGIIQWGGYFALFAIIFAETGLFFGFFLPGDSLLVTAGLLANTVGFNMYVLNILLIIAAVSGDAVGYYFGKKVGQTLFKREDSKLFKREYLLKTKIFYEKYGGKTILLARFIPIIRTFAPIVAGTAGMSYKKFAMYNIVGGILWVTSMIWTGYLLAVSFPRIIESIHILILVIIIMSFVPIFIEYWKHKKNEKK